MTQNVKGTRTRPAVTGLALAGAAAAVGYGLYKYYSAKPGRRKTKARLPVRAGQEPLTVGNRRALIVGLGIGGMSAALGLKKAGWEPVIIERSAERRTGGYFLGLSGEGFEAATYFGVRDALKSHTPEDYAAWEIDRKNQRHEGLRFTDQPNHPEVVLRGDIEAALWSGVESNGIEVRFSTTPVTIGSNSEVAVVRLRNTSTGQVTDEEFDLVVGADGVRSTVRREVFGPDEDYIHPFGSIVCAFQMKEQMPGVRPSDGLIVAEQNRSLWIFPFSDHPPTALFTYRPADVDAQFTMSHRDALHQAYAGMSGDGVIQFALDQFDKADNSLFDSVNKVVMPRWHHNRIVLLGDAAWCLTLYSGYGATSAMHGGAVMGKCLAEQPDVEQALMDWEDQMRPFIQKQGRLTFLKEQAFVPSNRLTFGIRSVLLTSGLLLRVRATVAKRVAARARLLNKLFGERTETA